MTTVVLPERIQLRRTKGWRKPADAIVVARPTRWGNPYHPDDYPTSQAFQTVEGEWWTQHEPWSTRLYWAYCDFQSMIRNHPERRAEFGYPSDEEIIEHLGGHPLCCWCPPEVLCHADILLTIANPDTKAAA